MCLRLGDIGRQAAARPGCVCRSATSGGKLPPDRDVFAARRHRAASCRPAGVCRRLADTGPG